MNSNPRRYFVFFFAYTQRKKEGHGTQHGYTALSYEGFPNWNEVAYGIREDLWETKKMTIDNLVPTGWEELPQSDFEAFTKSGL